MADQETRDRRSKSRVEVIVTVLLALAAVATAWSSYQANRWNGEQAKATGRTNALRIDGARSQGLAQAQTQVDIATFVQWVDAFANGRTELQSFYVDRFRPEFRKAFDVWIAAGPFVNPEAPISPFAIPEYRLAATDASNQFDREAEASAAMVQVNIQRSSNYVLAVVMFAIVLFFAGMSTRQENPRMRQALAAMGCVVFMGAIAWLATFPVTVSV